MLGTLVSFIASTQEQSWTPAVVESRLLPSTAHSHCNLLECSPFHWVTGSFFLKFHTSSHFKSPELFFNKIHPYLTLRDPFKMWRQIKKMASSLDTDNWMVKARRGCWVLGGGRQRGGWGTSIIVSTTEMASSRSKFPLNIYSKDIIINFLLHILEPEFYGNMNEHPASHQHHNSRLRVLGCWCLYPWLVIRIFWGSLNNRNVWN